MRPIDLVIGAIQARGLEAEDKGGGEWLCQCPAHNDRSPSLKVTEGRDGTVLMKCWSQKCPTDRIVMALGLELKDLFPPKPKKEKPKSDSKKVATYIYCDLNQVKKHATVRMEPKSFPQYRILPNNDQVWSYEAGWYEPKGKSWIRQKHIKNGKDDPPSASAMWFDAFTETYLFRVHLVVAAAEKGEVIWLCEGEKDSLNVGKQKDPDTKKYVNSTCQPMGAGHWKPDYTNWLKGAKVKQILDRDEAGYKHGLLVAEALAEAGIEHDLYLPAAGKDASDHLDAGLSLDELVLTSVGQVEELLLSVQQQQRKDELGAKFFGTGQGPVAPDEGSGGDGEPPKKKRKKENKDWDWGYAWETNDLANAKRFIAEHGLDLRYCANFGRWLSWNGSFWCVDETKGSPLMPKWETTLSGMKAQLLEIDDKDKRDMWGAWVKGSMAHPAFVKAMSFAQILPGVAVTPEDLDQEDDLIPVSNGVLDLRKGVLIGPAREQLFTKGVTIPYDPTADCPTWIEHLDRATGGDEELLSVLHKICGYLLTGRTSEQKLFFLYGEGQTGKSTTIRVLDRILGEFSKTIRKRYLMAGLPQGDEATVFASLKGARMVVAVEVQPNDKFEEGVIKMATGEDKITGRLMRENPFDYIPRFKLILTGNYRPRIEGQDHGIWRRFAMVPFDKQIKTVSDGFEKKIFSELPGILNWMAYGARRWYEEGGIGTCAAIDGATKEYREEQDVLRQFFADTCVFEEGARITSSRLFEIYKDWAKEGLIKPWSSTLFGREMNMREKHFPYQRRRLEGAVTFLGLRQKEAWDD